MFKKKIIATIELIYLSYLFFCNGLWNVWFKNKRIDFEIITKNIVISRKQKAVSYLKKLYKK